MPPRTRHSTPPPDDLDDILQAMQQSSPFRPSLVTNKRPRSSTDDDEDDINDEGFVVLGAANQNAVLAGRRFAESKRLRTEQIAAVEAITQDSSPVRGAKLMATMLAVGNAMDKIVQSQPELKIAPDFKENCSKTAFAVILSSKTNVYKGNGPTKLLLGIIKMKRWGLPDGVENTPSEWAKVIQQVEYALTQKRSKVKKAIAASIEEDNIQNIFDLATTLVKGTDLTVNIVLCARLALMRSVYVRNTGPDFWNKLDARIDCIREQAGDDNGKLVKAFRHVLDADRKIYAVTDVCNIPDSDSDSFQKEVDNFIVARHAANATKAAVGDAQTETADV